MCFAARIEKTRVIMNMIPQESGVTTNTHDKEWKHSCGQLTHDDAFSNNWAPLLKHTSNPSSDDNKLLISPDTESDSTYYAASKIPFRYIHTSSVNTRGVHTKLDNYWISHRSKPVLWFDSHVQVNQMTRVGVDASIKDLCSQRIYVNRVKLVTHSSDELTLRYSFPLQKY